MKQVTLVRHGQASFLDADYDKLCTNGEAQARLLGAFWLRRGVMFHEVYSGPRLRQRETARIVAEVYGNAGQSFPEVVEMSEFDEYQAEAVMRTCLPQLMQANSEIAELNSAYQSCREPGERRRNFQKLFEAVTGKWVSGETVAEGIETWHEFCLRVERGLMQVVRETSASSTVIFTSAGPIGAALRCVLHLSPQDTLQMSWMSRNASFTELRVSGERLTLSAFNAHPHLDEDELLTYW
jgi:broad specificity phosphatase PhoE